MRWHPGIGWAIVGGDAADVATAFDVPVHDYRGPKGQVYYASPQQPSIPPPLRGVVTGLGRIMSYTPHRTKGPGFLPLDVPRGGLTPRGLLEAYNATPPSRKRGSRARARPSCSSRSTVPTRRTSTPSGSPVRGRVTAAALATPAVARFVCPPHCGRPPIDEQVESSPRFVSGDGAFSVQYPGPGTAYEATLNPDGVVLEFVGGDTGTLELFGLPAQDRTPRQIAEDLIDEYYPDATTDYEIPNALVGYEPGYGVVLDEYPQDVSGTFTRLRLIVMVAVKDVNSFRWRKATG